MLENYKFETIAVESSDGSELGELEVRIPLTEKAALAGLGRFDSIDKDEGMLFTHDTVDEHAYVMRNMSFPIDIIWVDETGMINNIEHGRVTPDDEETPVYKGIGMHVLETNRGWIEEHGVTVGDQIEIPDTAESV